MIYGRTRHYMRYVIYVSSRSRARHESLYLAGFVQQRLLTEVNFNAPAPRDDEDRFRCVRAEDHIYTGNGTLHRGDLEPVSEQLFERCSRRAFLPAAIHVRDGRRECCCVGTLKIVDFVYVFVCMFEIFVCV